MFLALNDLIYAKGRFTLIGLVVALVAFLSTLLAGLSEGLILGNVSAVMNLPVTHIAFEYENEPNYRTSMVERTMWEGWAERKGVQGIAPIGYSFYTARAADDNTDEVLLWGIEPGSYLEPRVIDGEQLGRLENGVIVSQTLAEEGFAIGDVFTLDRALTELKVVGIGPRHTMGHTPLVFTPLRKWQEASYGPPGGPAPGEVLPDVVFDFATAITLQLDEGVNAEAADIELGTVTVPKEQSYAAQTGYEEEKESTQLIQVCLYLIAALVIGAFFSNWTIQRTHEIGLIKALGGSNRYILKEMLAQVLIVVLSAAIIGSGVALQIGSLLADAGIPYTIPLPTYITSLGLFVGASLAGAILSVRVIASIDPIIAMGRAP